MHNFDIGNITVGNDQPLTLIAGPCQLESADHAQMIAGTLKEACAAVGAGYIFKGSFDKANRTSLNAKPALGLDAGLKVLQGVRDTIGVPVLTDIHEKEQCDPVADAVDVMQIPAFCVGKRLCCWPQGKPVLRLTLKKGSFWPHGTCQMLSRRSKAQATNAFC